MKTYDATLKMMNEQATNNETILFLVESSNLYVSDIELRTMF